MKPAVFFVPFFLLWGTAFPVSANPAPPPPLRITNVTVIDGTGAPPLPGATILVRGGHIAAVGAGPFPPAPGERVLDGQGGFALPGLIDAHTHLASAPGGAFRRDSPETWACLWRHHLHGYLAAGVTSVLDNAITYDFARDLERYFAGGGVGPRVFLLAPFLTPPGGYFAGPALRGETYAGLWSPVSTRAEVAAHLEKARALEPVGVKVVIENGFGPFPVFNVFSPALRAAIREEAAKRGMPLFVHSMTNAAHRVALEMAPRTLVHSHFSGEEPDPAVVAGMKAAGVFLVTTVSAIEFPLWQWEPTGLDDPLVRLVVPPLEIRTARDPGAWAFQDQGLMDLNSPAWAPRFLVRWVGGWFYGPRILRGRLEAELRNIKRLYDAGIPLVMGSDSGNWPLFVSLFHGVGSVREMMLLAKAGIPPMAVLQAATRTAARMLGKQAQLGTLEPGKWADILILRANPLEDMGAIREAAWVVKGGVARRPAEWMALAPDCG